MTMCCSDFWLWPTLQCCSLFPSLLSPSQSHPSPPSQLWHHLSGIVIPCGRAFSVKVGPVSHSWNACLYITSWFSSHIIILHCPSPPTNPYQSAPQGTMPNTTEPECAIKSVPDFTPGRTKSCLTHFHPTILLWKFLLHSTTFLAVPSSSTGDWARVHCCLQANDSSCRAACIQVGVLLLFWLSPAIDTHQTYCGLGWGRYWGRTRVT